MQPLAGKARRSVATSTARFCIWEGAVRSSKTVASTFRWMRYVRKGPKGNLAMIGKTERTLKRNVIDPIIDMVGSKRARYLVGAGEFHLFGRRIYTAGANDARSVEKIQGLTLAGAYGDEIATWPEDLWDMLGTRLSVPGAQFFGTCNPAGPAHWLKKKWLDRADLWITHSGDTVVGKGETVDLHRYSFTLDDNPFLDAAFVASLKRQYVGLFRKRYIEGLWVPAEGAVYDMWDEARHVVAKLPRITDYVSLGIDFGTSAATAALLLGVGDDGDLYLTNEWRWDSLKRQRRLTNSEYADQLLGWTRTLAVDPDWWCADPSAAGLREDLLRLGKVTAAADNSVIDGIRLVASLLAQGLLKVHASCEGWIEEAPGYTWDEKASEIGEDKPVKVNDHSLDGGRYAIKTPEVVWRPLIRNVLDLAA
ncbi:MAG: PBSX family phage terminase large subunit [Hamadaea sp.]|nr:PBSX family phage terminase large subunit [Hamadaea sp.]